MAVIFAWNPTTLKVQAFWGNAGTAGVLPEVDASTDLSGYKALMIAFGKSKTLTASQIQDVAAFVYNATHGLPTNK